MRRVHKLMNIKKIINFDSNSDMFK